MNYTLEPSLEHIALIKIASELWNQDDIRVLTARYCLSSRGKGTNTWMWNFSFLQFETRCRRDMWQKILDKVIVKVQNLFLPRPFKEKLTGFVKPMGILLLQWFENFLLNGIDLVSPPKEFCWTSNGTVDVKRMAKVLIKDEKLDIADRYQIACVYCLEDDVRELWNKLPKNRKDYFYSKEGPCKVGQNILVILWTCKINGDLSKMDNMIEKEWQCQRFAYQYSVVYQMVGTLGHRMWSPYLFAFDYAVRVCNEAATKFFFKKLTPREKKENLVRCASRLVCANCAFVDEIIQFPDFTYANILHFLLSQMSIDQQMEIFYKYPYKVLICFLEWPWQSLFLEMANHMSGFLSEHDYNYILSRIVIKVIDGYKDCDYRKLFEQFWQQCCNNHKKLITNGTHLLLLSKLLEANDKKSISLILKGANLELHETMIWWINYADDWGLLKIFTHKSIGSTETKIIEENTEELEKQKNMWSEFIQLMNNLIHKHDKNNLRK